MGPGRWGALKDSGKIFFLSSQTSSLEENSRTPNARGREGGGGIWTHCSSRNSDHQQHELSKQKANTVPRLGPTPAIQKWPRVAPRFGPRFRPGLASGHEAESDRPVRECGAAGLQLSERGHNSAAKSIHLENPTLSGKTEGEEVKARPT